MVQGAMIQDRKRRVRCATLVPPVLALLLAGCSTLEVVNPVHIYHSIVGGEVAKDRPPPPGSDQGDPNLASVPPKPTPPDKEAMDRLTQGLIADRENTHYTNAATPLPDPSSPSASPSLFGAGTLPPPVKPAPVGAATASLPAASAPPAPPPASDAPAAPPSPAPRKAVESTPLAAPDQAPPAGNAPPAPPTVAAPAGVPTIPEAPPARPAAAPVAAPSPPAFVEPLPAAPSPAGTTGKPVSFDPGVSTLSSAELDSLKAFAAQRKGAAIAVTGYGDAVSSDPAAQASALALAITRAKAVAAALVADGVPANAIQTGTEAAGRGAFVRLLK
jgi:outer membrane protein OmpA-like peptidoglycan-associated protein